MKFYFYLLIFCLAVSAVFLGLAVIFWRLFPGTRPHIARLLKRAVLVGLVLSLGLVAFVTQFPVPDDFSRYCTAGFSPDPKYDPMSTPRWIYHILTDRPDVSWFRLLKSNLVVQFSLNLFLLAPTLFFLRSVWRHSLWSAIGISALISVAIEFTQLTAVWGLAPCRYRTFDLEDLLANVVSGALGWLTYTLIARPIARRLVAGLEQDIRGE